MSIYTRPRLSSYARQLGFRDPFDDFELESLFPDLIAQAEAQESLDLLKTLFDRPAVTSKPSEDGKQVATAPAASTVATAAPPTASWLRGVMNAPSVDVQETAGEFKVIADMPGINANDISVNISVDATGGKLLTISGTRIVESNSTQPAGSGSSSSAAATTVNTRESTTVNRALQLPTDTLTAADRIDAILHQGVLTITIPKAAPGIAAAKQQVANELKLRDAMGFEHLNYVPAGAPHGSVTPSALDLAKLQLEAKFAGAHPQQYLHHVCANCGHCAQVPTALDLAKLQLQAQAAGLHHERLHHVNPAFDNFAFNRGLMEWQVRHKIQRLASLKNALSSLLPRHVVPTDASADVLARAKIQIQVRHPPALHSVPAPNTAPSEAVKAAYIADRAQEKGAAAPKKN